MATYSSPNGATIRGYTKLNGDAYGLTDGELETALEGSVTDGEDATFGRIGDAYETATLTDRQARNLQRAVSVRTTVVYLRQLLFEKASGTHQPLLMEDTEAIRAMIDDFELVAEQLEGLVQGAGQAVDTEPAFALPVATSSTYERLSTDRSPFDRNELIDERDGIAADDLANG